MEIREYREEDWSSIWPILQEVFLKGDTYPNNPATNEEEAKEYWVEHPKYSLVAELNGNVIGSYHIKNNQVGLGSHIANASYIVNSDHRGNGIGALLAEHSIEFARQAGYLAMQFNLVVSTNEPSIALWKRFKFTEIGRVPEAFNHKRLGLVDALIMYKKL